LDRQKQSEETERLYLNRQLHQAYENTSNWLDWADLNRRVLHCLPPEQMEALEQVRTEAKQVAHHYQAYLNFQSPKIDLDRPAQRIGVKQLVLEISVEFKPIIDQKGLVLCLDIEEDLVITAGRDWLWSALYLGFDLVLCQGTNEEVCIQGFQTQGVVGLSFEASGLLLNRRQQNRVSTGAPLPPSLLGFEVIKKICVAHGVRCDLLFAEGSIHLCLEFNSPDLAVEAAPSKSPGVGLAPAPPTPRPKILLVDDHQSRLSWLSDCLSRDYQPVCALGGVAGLSAMGEQSFDLLIVQLDMPRVDGVDILQKLRKGHTAWELPIVLLTTQEELEGNLGFLESGANEVLPLPIDLRLLQPKLRALLSLKSQFKQLQTQQRKLDEQRGAERQQNNLWQAQLSQMRTSIRAEPQTLLWANEQGEVIDFSPSWAASHPGPGALAPGVKLSALFPWDWSPGVFHSNQAEFTVALQIYLEVAGRTVTFEMMAFYLPTGAVVLRHANGQVRAVLDREHIIKIKGFHVERALWRDDKQWPDFLKLKPLSPQPDWLGNLTETTLEVQKKQARNQAVCQLMSRCVALWESKLGVSRIELATGSGLWKVCQDKQGQVRAKTLTRYLSLRRIPENPRLGVVVETAHYVINHLKPQHPAYAAELEFLLNRLG